MPEQLNQNSRDNASILIVDDNPRNLQLMSTVLKEKGYKLYVTNSGENALLFLQHTLPDLILLDVMMPGLSGFEVCRRIQRNEKLRDIPVIFLTAKNDVEDVVEGFEAGAVDYVTKPFNTKEVFVRISTHLQLKKAKEMLILKNQEMKALNATLSESKAIIEDDARRLEKLNIEKNKFFSIISHDLRGPLSGLIGLSEIMLTQADTISKGELKEYAGLLFDSSNQVFNLLENLLEWSRMQMNAVSFNPEQLRLKPLLENTAQLLKQEIQKKNHQLKLDCPDDLEVYADQNMLKTVIRNMVANAIKFTRPGGKIDVTALKTGNGDTEIIFKDTGIGMSETLLQSLFKIDSKTSRPGTDGESSTGLGLLLCKDFIQKHGGAIKAKSVAGEGTIFFVTFPVKTV
jgi:two-component system, sensor histidine kinase and response regulator